MCIMCVGYLKADWFFFFAFSSDHYQQSVDPQTPERARNSERERDRVRRLQMTSPTIRRQRVYDRQTPIPQPNFGMPLQPHIPSHFQAHMPAYYSLNNHSYDYRQGAVPHYMPRYDSAQGASHAAPQTLSHHWPVPVDAYPGLPRHDIAHLQRRAAYHQQARHRSPGPNGNAEQRTPQHSWTNWNDRLNTGFQTRHAERVQQRRQQQSHTAGSTESVQGGTWQTNATVHNQRQQNERNTTGRHQTLAAQRQNQRSAQPRINQDIRQAQHNADQEIHDQHIAQQAANNQAAHMAQVQHNQQQVNEHNILQQIPPARRPYHDPGRRHTIGSMTVECTKCHASHFDCERLTNSSRRNPKFGMCCLTGQIQLPPLLEPPPTLRNLLMGVAPQSRTFREKIRRYNAAFAFTSTAVKLDESLLSGTGTYCFRMHGSLHHNMGALLPNDGARPAYAQLYINDPQAARIARAERNPNLNPMIMTDLQAMLNDVHPYVPLYKQAYQLMAEKPVEEQANVQAKITLQPTADRRRFNLPTVDEIAAIIPGNGEEDIDEHREILLRLKAPQQGYSLKRISHLNPLYSPLHYVLLFPHGEQGWHNKIPSTPGDHGQVRSEYVSQRCYYAYRLHPRNDEPKTIFFGGRLFQQYVVDAWSSVESSSLYWLRKNQTKIRADLYQGVRNAANAAQVAHQDNGPADLGQQGTRIVLPSSHAGSARHMYQLFQDSMAICRHCRKPDIFLTMTANPKWPEIQEALSEFDGVDDDPERPRTQQTASDRPDIVARVFHQKMKALLKDIKGDKGIGIFGKVAGMVYTIEFQKRGLPHMHLLIFLEQQYKIHDAAAVDSMISAQIPDPDLHPLLYETVTTCMMHGLCGPEYADAPCMVDGKCSKHYPKEFNSETRFGEDGYPEYARPNNGRTYTNYRNQVFDNRSVIPYCPYLSAKFNCHINVEICASVKAVKYIHKYIYKGHDLCTVQVGQDGNANPVIDEINEYIDGRYIGPVEACWHIFEFPMHSESPTVYRLPVHLKDEQVVYYHDDDDAQEVADRAASRDTHLTGWMKANQIYPEACQYTYQEFPQHFVCNAKTKHWTPRQRGDTIGRMHFVHPSAGERFYLRTLLTVVKGAKNFDDIKTFDGIVHPTYKAACLARGLLEDDGEWNLCLTEAGEMQTGSQLRSLFAHILLHCQPAEPSVLWAQHKDKICDDLQHRLITKHNIAEPTNDQIYDYGLYLLDQILLKFGKHLSDYNPMPISEFQWDDHLWDNFLMQEQMDYDAFDLLIQVDQNKERFNNEQRAVYDAVMQSVLHNEGKAFFLHSAGGGGKTFVCNTVAASVRANNKVALSVASSAIAALILDGGRTAHSRFKIPIPIHESSTCNIPKQSELAQVLRETGIIIWDETPMQHRHAIEALNRTLQDILNNDKPFGGITVLFGGDFRQTTPVVPRGSREKIVNASLKRSSLWNNIHLYHLKQNMRLDRTPESDAFADWLLDVGAGNGLDANNSMQLQPNMRMPENSVESLISGIYPGIANGNKEDDYFLQRTILSPKNDAVDDINKSILDKFPGQETILTSTDKITTGEDIYPVEYLQSLKGSGLPLSQLALKPGCPLMLLRNINPAEGLCNGTRMILMEIKTHVLQCRILGGKHAGHIVFIPRINIEPSGEEMPIPLSRRQFPVRLAFAMTINKSQGQSVVNVGLDLRIPVFSHGQLYVALSRCTSGNRIKVLFPDGSEGVSTTNIVYKELLTGLLNPW